MRGGELPSASSTSTSTRARPSAAARGWTTRSRGGASATRLQIPVAYLNCNFSRPVGGKPALFTHDDVITLFHEFGHGLHHLLTRVEDLGVSGINGVEWDAVELPSQFMENFCWEWDVLRAMTRHVDTRCSRCRAACSISMLAAKNFQSGLATLRQIEFAVFDMRLHSDFDPAIGAARSSCSTKCAREVAVLMPPAYNRFPNSFSHIFAGGYAAGYYSYKWAEVLSADAYSFFEENGMLDREGRCRASATRSSRRRQPAGGGIVQGLPRPRAECRSLTAPQRDDRGLESVTPRARRRPSPLSTIWRSRRG